MDEWYHNARCDASRALLRAGCAQVYGTSLWRSHLLSQSRGFAPEHLTEEIALHVSWFRYFISQNYGLRNAKSSQPLWVGRFPFHFWPFIPSPRDVKCNWFALRTDIQRRLLEPWRGPLSTFERISPFWWCRQIWKNRSHLKRPLLYGRPYLG